MYNSIILYNWLLILCDSEIVHFGQKKGCMRILFMRGSTWGCAYPIVDINYENYICVISVLLHFTITKSTKVKHSWRIGHAIGYTKHFARSEDTG